MIKFIDLKIRNFLSVSEADLQLDNQGLVLIEGINADDPSAVSNGAGKSSIVDAISWCLYGQTARGVTGDSVVNIKAGKNTEVMLTMEIDGNIYQITRGRKHKDLKNRVQLTQLTASTAPWSTLTLGTDRMTQERINQLLGCTPDIFNASIYMGQERMPDLPNMTDKALKAILEEALSLDKLDDALEICKQRLATAIHDATTAEQQRDRAEQMIAVREDENKRIADQITLASANIVTLESELSILRDNAVAETKKFKAEQQAAKDELDAIGPQPTITDINKDVNESVSKEVSDLHAMQKLYDDAVDEESRLSVILHAAGNQLRALGAGACPMCGSETPDAAHIATEKARLELEIESTVAKLTVAEDESQRLRDIKRDLVNKIDELKEERRTAMMTAIARSQTLTRQLEYVAHRIDTVKSAYTASRNSLDRQAKVMRDNVTSYQEQYEVNAADIVIHAELVDKNQKLRDAANQRVEVLEKVKHVLGRKGFRGEVLDQVTPYLNARTQHYLNQLTDDNIAATWSTVSENSAGDYVESFHIDVAHKSGVSDFNALSGGEKRKVRLATALALQDLVGTRVVKPIKLFVADEIDDAIDAAGLELLMGLLEQKARDVGTVFVISHNDIGDWFRNKITVVKQDGQSTFK